MLDLPPGCRADDLGRLADWLEASALVQDAPIPRAELIEELRSSGLALPQGESFGEDSDELGIDADEDSDSALERLSDDIFTECRNRATLYPQNYPFLAASGLLTIRRDVAYDGYAFLLIADLGHHYPQLKDAIKADSHSGRLMEKIVEGALQGLFGRSQRFGWPIEPEWPTSIEDRVATLALHLDVKMDSLEGKTDPADKDRTLDVVGLFEVVGSAEATLAVLVQCAAGKDWKQKLGAPSVQAWSNLMLWETMLIRAIALPWRLGGRKGDWTYGRIFSMSGGAMVLDRPRLLAGNPDKHLDPLARVEVARWWRNAVDAMPKASSRTT